MEDTTNTQENINQTDLQKAYIYNPLPLAHFLLTPFPHLKLKTMKQFKSLLMASFAAMLLFSTSCNDEQDDPATNEATGDTTAATTTPAVEPAAQAPQAMMLVRHKVKDYAKWKASYDSHDSMRLAHGMHSFVIGRGVEDPNMILVAVRADDVEKAKAFGKSADLKKAMENGGVVGTPKVFLANILSLRTNASSDLRSISFFKVKDWETWKSHFEGNKQSRLEYGLEDRGYGHEVDDNHNGVYVASILDSAKARDYQGSALMKQRLDSSGIVGKPERFWYRVAQTY